MPTEKEKPIIKNPKKKIPTGDSYIPDQPEEKREDPEPSQNKNKLPPTNKDKKIPVGDPKPKIKYR